MIQRKGQTATGFIQFSLEMTKTSTIGLSNILSFMGFMVQKFFLGVHGTEEESDCSQGHTAPPGNPQASHDSPVSLGDEMFKTDPETRPELLGRAWQRVIRRD